ncbi:MAG: hypothetical protein E6Z79_04550, partial [Haemophilus parainfluenzae]|nr:hypothetical protein [Haemophilus parainfluenzae]
MAIKVGITIKIRFKINLNIYFPHDKSAVISSNAFALGTLSTNINIHARCNKILPILPHFF